MRSRITLSIVVTDQSVILISRFGPIFFIPKKKSMENVPFFSMKRIHKKLGVTSFGRGGERRWVLFDGEGGGLYREDICEISDPQLSRKQSGRAWTKQIFWCVALCSDLVCLSSIQIVASRFYNLQIVMQSLQNSVPLCEGYGILIQSPPELSNCCTRKVISQNDCE